MFSMFFPYFTRCFPCFLPCFTHQWHCWPHLAIPTVKEHGPTILSINHPWTNTHITAWAFTNRWTTVSLRHFSPHHPCPSATFTSFPGVVLPCLSPLPGQNHIYLRIHSHPYPRCSMYGISAYICINIYLQGSMIFWATCWGHLPWSMTPGMGHRDLPRDHSDLPWSRDNLRGLLTSEVCYGGFHKWRYPSSLDGFFVDEKIPSRNGWWLRVPLF